MDIKQITDRIDAIASGNLTVADPGDELEHMYREAELLARNFASTYPTAAVNRAITLCESGHLAWIDVAALFARSFATARDETTHN